MAANTSPQTPVNTLAIDIGGTGLKASVLDATGRMEHDRVRVDTPYPLSPQKLVLELQGLISQLPPFDRISVGFPGMVRGGRILSAPHFISPDGPSGTPAPKLVRAWQKFDLAGALEDITGKPTKVANDADVQGAAVIEGKGFELVVTLGTGVGTAFFSEGQLVPHFEFAHHPLQKGKTYNELIGDAARKKIGNKKWRPRVMDMIETLRALCFFDHCFIGGGNATRLGSDLPEGVSLVDNSAGILGGIKLWDVTRGHAGEYGNAKHRTLAPPASSATRAASARRRPATSPPGASEPVASSTSRRPGRAGAGTATTRQSATTQRTGATEGTGATDASGTAGITGKVVPARTRPRVPPVAP